MKKKKYLKRNTHLFKNYRHAQDDVVQYQDGNLEGVQGRDGFGTIYWVFGSSHKIFDWQFNEQGQVIDEHGRVVITAQRLIIWRRLKIAYRLWIQSWLHWWSCGTV